MAKSDKQNDPTNYANKFKELQLDAWKLFQEQTVTKLIKKHVEGIVTLDYGCGPGISTLYLKSLGLQVEGVDANPKMIHEAKLRDPSVKYSVIKSCKIISEDNYYDFVYACWVLPYVGSIDEMTKIFKEVKRVLKKGGTFIVVGEHESKFNGKWSTITTDFKENRGLKSGALNKTMFTENNFVVYTYYWNENDYKGAFKEAGLTMVDIYTPPSTSELTGIDKEIEHSYVSIYVAQKIHN